MGAALARAALLMGGDVVVITGPTRVPLPHNTRIVRVGSAVEMLQAGMMEAADSDLIIGAAAVADYRPASPFKGKMRRSSERMTLELVPNPDVIAALAQSSGTATVVGFAAEPDDSLDTARAKLARKGLTAIAVNDVSQPGIGFDSDSNALRLISRDREEVLESGVMSKLGCALWLLEQVVGAPA